MFCFPALLFLKTLESIHPWYIIFRFLVASEYIPDASSSVNLITSLGFYGRSDIELDCKGLTVILTLYLKVAW